MNRESALAIAAVGVVALALLVAAVVPGAVADPSEGDPIRPGPVRIADVAVQPGNVSASTAVLRVDTSLAHYGNPTRNVTVRVRAIDSESGFVETTETVRVGDLSGDREVTAPANLTVRREGGYRIETVVYRDGERIAAESGTVSGLEGLTPEWAKSSVRFAETGALPALSYSIAESDDNRTSLAIEAALTNGGDDSAENLRLTIVLRQAESNVVAARQSASVGAVGPLETATAGTEVTVPSGYNYYVDAILWKGDVVVDTARSAANLDPTRQISVEQTETEVEFEASDFESQDGGGGGESSPSPTETGASTPGFGAGVAVAAILAVALLVWRRER